MNEAHERLDAVIAGIVSEIGATAAQYAVAVDGRVVLGRSFGAATAHSRFCLFSASKPVFAFLVLRLVGEGRLDLDAPVAALWPEFGVGGKERITLAQLLTFSAGIPSFWPDEAAVLDADLRAAQLAALPIETEPGTAYAYHPVSAHWVLAELVRRVTGLDHAEALNTLVLDPLGVDRMRLGPAVEDQGDVQRVAAVGEYDLPLAEAMLGVRLTAAQLDALNAPVLAIANDPRVMAAGTPGGGIVSDAASAALFYQALLHGDERLWPDALRRRALVEIGNGLVDTARGGAPANRTIGSLTVAGEDVPQLAYPELGFAAPVRHHGTRTSPRTVGHAGFGGQLAFADPDRGYSFAFVSNGLERNHRHGVRRDREIADAVADAFA